MIHPLCVFTIRIEPNRSQIKNYLRGKENDVFLIHSDLHFSNILHNNVAQMRYLRPLRLYATL